MKKILQAQKALLAALFTALTLVLAACGGGSSAGGGGGGSGSTIAGVVDDGLASIWSPKQDETLIVAVSELFISSAHAGGMPGVVVELLDSSGGVISAQTTDDSGEFRFSGLSSGTYSVRLSQNGDVIGQSPNIDVSPGTTTNIEIAANGTILEVEVSDDGIEGEIEDDDSSDDGSSDDDSVDDDSSDDDSLDDDSSDDDSSDDDSLDDDDDSEV